MLTHLKPEQLVGILFIIALMIIALGVARADTVQMGMMSDTITPPDNWQPFTYNPDIPLRESLQCILWGTCLEYGVPLEYALAIIQTESGFQEDADSGAAHGLMQLHKYYYDPNMPPGENIIAGVKLLSDNYAKYGNWPAAITSYAVGHDNGTRAYWQIIEYRAEHWKEVLRKE